MYVSQVLICTFSGHLLEKQATNKKQAITAVIINRQC